MKITIKEIEIEIEVKEADKRTLEDVIKNGGIQLLDDISISINAHDSKSLGFQSPVIHPEKN